MKVGLVLDDSLDKPDGIQQYVITVGEWLRAKGHDVHYLVGQTKRSDLPNIHSLSRNVKVNFNHNRMSIPLPVSRRSLRKMLADEQFDVLHIQMPYSPWLAGRIIKEASKTTAVIGTFHILPFSTKERWAAKLLGLYLKHNAKRFDMVMAVSTPAAHFAKKTFKVNPVLLPNAIVLKHFAGAQKIKKYDDGKLNIVFLGRLVERKGCMQLLEAVQKLHAKNGLMNVRVLIGGRGPLQKQIENFIQKHRLGAHVQMLGFIPEMDKAALLATANLAVFPSLGGESFGIVLVEAMAAGSEVVIGGRNPGYASVLQERKDQLVKPKDSKAFAKTLKHFITNSAARRHAHSWQQKHVAAYDVGVIGKQIEQLYARALHNRKEMR